ncbi:MAG: diaminopimelate epimerase [Rhodospirillaceae bacterium]
MTTIDFIKMHGLGNDFVVIDGRESTINLPQGSVRTISNRHTGIGCDQVIVMQPSQNADVFMRIFNADGSEVAACGNATRCVARLLQGSGQSDHVSIETLGGFLKAYRHNEREIRVDMGPPLFNWCDIPIANKEDTLHLPIEIGNLRDPAALSMGNPHCVFFVEDVDAIDLAKWGPEIEGHSLFPERTNVEIAQIIDGGMIRLRVWERGAGITLACGTGACAAAVSAHRRGLTERRVRIKLDGGDLDINWGEDDHVTMTGEVAITFTGSFNLSALGELN